MSSDVAAGDGCHDDDDDESASTLEEDDGDDAIIAVAVTVDLYNLLIVCGGCRGN